MSDQDGVAPWREQQRQLVQQGYNTPYPPNQLQPPGYSPLSEADVQRIAEAVVRAQTQRDGARPLPFDRDQLGRFVREAWVRWAETQPNPKPAWLVPYDELSEADKEADRQIGEAVARWTLIGDAAKNALAD